MSDEKETKSAQAKIEALKAKLVGNQAIMSVIDERIQERAESSIFEETFEIDARISKIDRTASATDLMYTFELGVADGTDFHPIGKSVQYSIGSDGIYGNCNRKDAVVTLNIGRYKDSYLEEKSAVGRQRAEIRAAELGLPVVEQNIQRNRSKLLSMKPVGYTITERDLLKSAKLSLSNYQARRSSLA